MIILVSVVLRVLPQTKRVKKLRHNVYMAKLLRKNDFHSNVEWNVQRARDLGVKVGENCRFFGAIKYSTEPYLIEIGDIKLTLGDLMIITGLVLLVLHLTGIV